MSLIVLPNRDQWLLARLSLITASDLPIILGVAEPDSPWAMTADQLAQLKCGLIEPPTRSGDVDEWAWWGLANEPNIAQRFSMKTGYAIRTVAKPDEYAISRCDAYPWFGATLDRETLHPQHGWIPLELKNVGYSQRGDWLKMVSRSPRRYEELTPREKWIQAQGQLFATGAQVGFIAACLGGNTFQMREIERNDAFISEQIIPAITKFHDRIEAFKKEPAHVR